MLLKKISYYKTGGSFERLYSPSSIEEVAEVIYEINKDRLPYFLLGAGSNSLVMDEHWPGAVITFSNLKKYQINKNKIIAQAGIDNSEFAMLCIQSSLAGASWMYKLPGQLGSTIRMNARCYGGEISQIVDKIKSVAANGEIKDYQGKQALTGYKNTIFMNNNEIVVEAEFQLKNGVKQEIENHMNFCSDDRTNKGQFLFPSCGCVFKNDYSVGIPSGLLLDKAGVRTLNRSNVEISPYHANFVFNKGAEAREILEVTLQMREMVFKTFGVWLEYEMEILGGIPPELKNQINLKKSPEYKVTALQKLREQFKSQ